MNKDQTYAKAVLDQLRTVIHSPVTELQYTTPFELLVAVLLSAQCTDARVNLVTPALFEAYPDAHVLAKADVAAIFPYIKSVSFPNNKAQHLAKLGKILVEKYAGEVPTSIEAIETLPGCGHKTAQVVASVAFDIPALPVDTHVFRVSNRMGLAAGKTVLEVEKQLKSRIPEAEWSEAHHLLILHGRYTCTAQSPKCQTCVLTMACTYFAQLQSLPEDRKGLNAKLGKYFCATCEAYTDIPLAFEDAEGVEQLACPNCQSTHLFNAKTGKTTLKIKDYRV